MAIDKISSGQPVVPASDNAKAKSKRAEKLDTKDRVELSDEAKLLFAVQKAKKYGEIRAKVKNRFYDAPEVTEKVVEGLMRDIKSSSQS